MYSIYNLLCSLAIALTFVIMFMIQRKLTPLKYYSTLQFIKGENVTFLMVIIRIFMLLILGFSSYTIFSDVKIVLLGAIVGSILIVWPVVLNPRESFEVYITKKEVLLSIILHLLFVVSAVSIVYTSIIFYDLIFNFALNQLINVFNNYFVIILFAVFGFPSTNKFKDMLNRKVYERSDRELEKLEESQYGYGKNEVL
ncbi:hypothetical protein E2R51_02270 [Jeotgalibacillus sp. S-D1]|uniref:hypothetical protein n=1 Tax=Jeotgalibacillus sp. S-D1 TaxID=2552189 RepID=UPI00105A2D93|nr:hypothetical protein [Jeotgalibacillus sp. S-D1]TDL34562.1 hypothetical protein E2R51_02270 [Jeotgalibacillus sp. S-D1]